MSGRGEPVGAGRPIGGDEPSGVLHPEHLDRYAAHWIDPDPAVGQVVDQYWHVRWHLDDGEEIDQRIIDLPAITVTIEAGGVPAGLVVTGLQSRAWRRRIAGTGEVFAIRLRPAGLAALSSLTPQELADETVPLTARLDDRLHDLMARVAREATPEARARAADALIGTRIRDRPVSATQSLANRILDELRSRAYLRTGTPLAEHFGVSERTVQRAFATTLGIGPKQAARRIRLQAVAQAVAMRGEKDLADIAVELGYTDQAHLTGDFRATTGLTPGAYRRDLRRLMQG